MNTFKISTENPEGVFNVPILGEFKFYGIRWIIHMIRGIYTVSEYSTGGSIGTDKLVELNDGEGIKSEFVAQELAVKLLKKIGKKAVTETIKKYPIINL